LRRSDGTTWRWFQQLDHTSKLGEAVLGCPSEREWVCGRNNSYGYNYKYLGSARRLTDGSVERTPVRIIQRSGHTIAFGDSSGTGTFDPYEPLAFAKADSDLAYSERKTRIGNAGFLLDPTHIPSRTDRLHGADTYADGDSPSFVAARHRGKANFCMADGHVEGLYPEDVYKDNGWWNGHGREIPRDNHVTEKLPGLNERYGW
jgi:prepilin-type processing-associated H-X9-DG protein